MKEKLLEMLRGGELLSGGYLSRRLGVSRTAIWKAVQALREDGYDISALPRQGYRLLSVPDRLYPWEISRGLGAGTFGRLIYHHNSLGSTNDEARRLARDGAPEGTLVVAEGQTGGRGRLGRVWVSPPGKGVWVSLLLRPSLAPAAAPQLTLLAAAAVAAALERAAGVKAGIKWPNDLLLHGRKICGILTEMEAEQDIIHAVVVGIGLNANMEEEDFPLEVRDQASSLLLATGRRSDRAALVRAFLEEMECLYKIYLTEGFPPVLACWLERNVTLGRDVQVRWGDRVFCGRAEGLQEDGALLVLGEDGMRHSFYAGDVTLRG